MFQTTNQLILARNGEYLSWLIYEIYEYIWIYSVWNNMEKCENHSPAIKHGWVGNPRNQILWKSSNGGTQLLEKSALWYFNSLLWKPWSIYIAAIASWYFMVCCPSSKVQNWRFNNHDRVGEQAWRRWLTRDIGDTPGRFMKYSQSDYVRLC